MDRLRPLGKKIDIGEWLTCGGGRLERFYCMWSDDVMFCVKPNVLKLAGTKPGYCGPSAIMDIASLIHNHSDGIHVVSHY